MINAHGVLGYDVYCDPCGFSENIEAESWGELMRTMKSEGWRTVKEGEDWEHRCPSCNSTGGVFNEYFRPGIDTEE